MEADYRAIAARSGLSLTTVTDHLSGRSRASAPTRVKIERAIRQVTQGESSLLDQMEYAVHSLCTTTLQALQVASAAVPYGGHQHQLVEDARVLVRSEVDMLLAALKLHVMQQGRSSLQKEGA